MRRIITRRHVGFVGTGLLVVTLTVLAALQASGAAGNAAAELALLRRTAAVAAAQAAPSPSSPPSPSPTPTPTPTPAPTPTAVPSTPAPDPTSAPPAPARPTYSRQDIEAILTAAADADGVDPAWLISTATCESNLNAYAYNPSGPYEGILQFLPSTFRVHGGTDIWDPTQQAQIAASMFAEGESGAWPVCSRR